MKIGEHPTGHESKAGERILFVDDEPFVLEGVRRALYKDFQTDAAGGPEEGLLKVQEEGPYAVVVSDMRMPVMDGAEFLSRVSVLAPDAIRVMLTGYADIEAAVRAVNEGKIFRFLNKPVSPEALASALHACLGQYRLLKGEKELLEKTLAGAVGVLSEVLGLANPVAFSKGSRIRSYVKHMATKLDLPDVWQFEIAAMLSHIGCVTLTAELLEAVHANQSLPPEAQQRYDRHPHVGHKLLAGIPRLESVAEMVLRQNEPASALKNLNCPDRESVKAGAQMLKVALAYDRMLSEDTSEATALALLAEKTKEYDSSIVAALADLQQNPVPMEVIETDVRDLRTGMILWEDLRTVRGTLLVAKGQEVTYAVAKGIRNSALCGNTKSKVHVMVPKIKIDSQHGHS